MENMISDALKALLIHQIKHWSYQQQSDRMGAWKNSAGGSRQSGTSEGPGSEGDMQNGQIHHE